MSDIYKLLAKSRVMRRKAEGARAAIFETSDAWKEKLNNQLKKADGLEERAAILKEREKLP